MRDRQRSQPSPCPGCRPSAPSGCSRISPGCPCRRIQSGLIGRARGDQLGRDGRGDEPGRVELQSPHPHLFSGVSRRCPLCSGEGPACDPQPERHEIGCPEGKPRDGADRGVPVPAELPPRGLYGVTGSASLPCHSAPARRLPGTDPSVSPHLPRCSRAALGRRGRGMRVSPLSCEIPTRPRVAADPGAAAGPLPCDNKYFFLKHTQKKKTQKTPQKPKNKPNPNEQPSPSHKKTTSK